MGKLNRVAANGTKNNSAQPQQSWPELHAFHMIFSFSPPPPPKKKVFIFSAQKNCTCQYKIGLLQDLGRWRDSQIAREINSTLKGPRWHNTTPSHFMTLLKLLSYGSSYVIRILQSHWPKQLIWSSSEVIFYHQAWKDWKFSAKCHFSMHGYKQRQNNLNKIDKNSFYETTQLQLNYF